MEAPSPLAAMAAVSPSSSSSPPSLSSSDCRSIAFLSSLTVQSLALVESLASQNREMKREINNNKKNNNNNAVNIIAPAPAPIPSPVIAAVPSSPSLASLRPSSAAAAAAASSQISALEAKIASQQETIAFQSRLQQEARHEYDQLVRELSTQRSRVRDLLVRLERADAAVEKIKQEKEKAENDKQAEIEANTAGQLAQARNDIVRLQNQVTQLDYSLGLGGHERERLKAALAAVKASEQEKQEKLTEALSREKEQREACERLSAEFARQSSSLARVSQLSADRQAFKAQAERATMNITDKIFIIEEMKKEQAEQQETLQRHVRECESLRALVASLEAQSRGDLASQRELEKANKEKEKIAAANALLEGELLRLEKIVSDLRIERVRVLSQSSSLAAAVCALLTNERANESALTCQACMNMLSGSVKTLAMCGHSVHADSCWPGLLSGGGDSLTCPACALTGPAAAYDNPIMSELAVRARHRLMTLAPLEQWAKQTHEDGK